MREDGGTPGFLQAIKAALAIELKEEMGIDFMHRREKELVRSLFKGLREIPGLVLLADHIEDRLGMLSFYFTDIHYNLVVKLLNDRFGIQARGGCSCAGTYGHHLLHVDHYTSKRITDKIDGRDLSSKPALLGNGSSGTHRRNLIRAVILSGDSFAAGLTRSLLSCA